MSLTEYVPRARGPPRELHLTQGRSLSGGRPEFGGGGRQGWRRRRQTGSPGGCPRGQGEGGCQPRFLHQHRVPRARGSPG